MGRYLAMVALLGLAVVLAGCGGDGTGVVASAPPTPGDSAHTLDIGPMLVRPAGTAGFKAENVPSAGSCAFVALHGSRINYLASQALLDRVVFASPRDGFWDIWMCDLDGGNPVQLTNNGATEAVPVWSPDGTKIAFQRHWPSQDTEIMTMNADGSTIRSLTDNSDEDGHPSFSPNGRQIAFHTDRAGNYEIYTMYRDGSGATNVTNHASQDKDPDWSPRATDPDILFDTDRHGAKEIYKINADGTGATRLTNNSVDDLAPAWHPDGAKFAFHSDITGGFEIMTANVWASGDPPINFSNSNGVDAVAAYSSDGRYIAFTSLRSAAYETYLQQTEAPYRAFCLTASLTDFDAYPDLGSPTMQTERVLIGPPGSDWGDLDPIWPNAYAGIVAFDARGYRNFVRIGIAAAHVGSLQVSPMQHPGMALAGVAVVATKIVNLREDAGRGLEPTLWQLDPLDAGAVLLYFDAYTGDLASVLAARDVAYPAARSADATDESPAPWRQRVEGGRLVVEGDFAAVFDAEGRNVVPDGAHRVVLDDTGAVVEAH